MRHVVHIVLIIVVAGALLVAMFFAETYWLQDRVVPIAATRLPEWIADFQLWSFVGIVGSLLLSSLPWYLLGQWGLSFTQWNRNYRPIWALFLIVPIALGVASCLFTKPTIEGSNWACAFYFLNNLLTFYLASLLFSPAPVMYVPLGAEVVRRGW
jgi:hypothetical protein